MENIRRNLRNENEDDLMRMFEEFKRSGAKPSANVRKVGAPVKVSSAINSSNSTLNNTTEIQESNKIQNDKIKEPSVQKKDVVDLGLNNFNFKKTEIKKKPKKKSLFAMRQESGNKLKDVRPFTPKIPKGNTILSRDVVESENTSVSKFSKKKYYFNGFPEVTFDYPEIKDKIEKDEEKENDDKCTCGLNNCYCHMDNENNNTLLTDDKIISNADKEAIHKENMSIIGNMSQNEILEMQKELQSKLSPDTLKWLKERRSKRKLANNNSSKNESDSLHSSVEDTTMSSSSNTDSTKTKKLITDLLKSKLSTSALNLTSAINSLRGSDDQLQDSKINSTKKLKENGELDDNKRAFVENNKFNTSSLEDISDIDMIKMAENEATSKEELEKIEWMKPIENNKHNNNEGESNKQENKNESPAVSKLRFDFKGKVLDKNSNISMSEGLHHHGDDPTQAGYTLDEFLYLTRSTVFSQKSICLQALSCCIRNAYSGKYNSQLATDIINYLMKQKSIINIRMALDDSNETVIVSALKALAAFLGKSENIISSDESSSYYNKSFQPLNMISRCNNFYIFCLNPRNIKNYSIRISGSSTKKNLQEELLDNASKESENSIEYHAEIVSKNIVKGLLKMSILQRLNYLLKYYPLPPSAFDDVIWIVSIIALHSKKAANEILKHKNILYQIVDECLSINWPLALDFENQVNYPILGALNLVKILCQSSRDNAQYILDSGILTILIRFILLGPNDVDKDIYSLACLIQENVLHIFKIIIDYGLYSSSFSDIRESILKYFGSIGTTFMTSEMLVKGVEEDIWRMNSHFQFLSSLFNYLTNDNISNDEYYDPETLLQPFLKNILEFLLELNTITFESSYNDTRKFLSIQTLISNGLHLINSYIKYLAKKQFNLFNKNDPDEKINNDNLNSILKLSNIETDKFISNITNDFSVSLCSRLKIFKLIWNNNKLNLIKLYELKNEKGEQIIKNSSEFFEFDHLPGWYYPTQIEYIDSFINMSMLCFILQKRIESQILLGINDEAYDDDVMMIVKQILLILVHPEYTSLSWTSMFINNLVQALSSWTIYAQLDWEKEINKLTDLKINEYFQLWYLVILYILPKFTINDEEKAKYIINCLFKKENLKFLFKTEFNNVFLNDNKNLSDVILQKRIKQYLENFNDSYLSLIEYSEEIKQILNKMFNDKNKENEHYNISTFYISYKITTKEKKSIKELPLSINWVFKLIDEALKVYNTPKELINNIKSILFYIFIVLKNISLQQVLLNSPVCLKTYLKDQVINSFGMTNDWMMFELMKIYLITCEGSGENIEQDETYEIFNDIEITRLLIELYSIILKYDRYRNNYMMKNRIVRTLYSRLEKNSIIQSAYCPFNNQFSVSLYKNLMEQFKSSSFGDKVFICYIVYPIQGRYLNEFKELFWNEVQDNFSRLFPSNISSLKNDNVDENIRQKMKEINEIINDLITPQRGHIELFRSTFINWLKPYESNLNLLQCMYKCILSVINYELSFKSELNEIVDTITVVKDILLENKIGSNFSILNRYISKKSWIYWIAVGHISQYIFSKFNNGISSNSMNSAKTSSPYLSTSLKFNNKELYSANVFNDLKKSNNYSKEELEQFFTEVNKTDKEFMKYLFMPIKSKNNENDNENLINDTLKFDLTSGGLFKTLLKDVYELNYIKKMQIYDFLYQTL